MTNMKNTNDLPCVAHALLAHELLFVRRIVEMIDRRVDGVSVIGLAMTPFLALIAFETDQWLRQISAGEVTEHNEWARILRMHFKGLASSGLTVQSYDAQCRDVARRSSQLFKSSTRLAILRPFQKDFGVHVLDGIEVSSTLGVARCLFTHRDNLAASQGTVPSMAETSSDMGFMLGRHMRRLNDLMADVKIRDLRPYTSPEASRTTYDYHLNRYLKEVDEAFGGHVPLAILFTLSDAYYELGIIEVLARRGILDSVLATKLRIIALYEFAESASKLDRYAYSGDHGVPINPAISNQLTTLLDRKDRRLIQRFKDARNVLVHYGPTPTTLARADTTMSISHDDALESIASLVGSNWSTLQFDVSNIAKSFRDRAKHLVGIRLSTDDEMRAKGNG